MLTIQIVLSLFILVLFFVKLRLGIALYIAYIFLIPYCSIPFGGLNLSWNFLNSVLLFSYMIYSYRRVGRLQIDVKPFIPFFIFYGLLLIEMLFQVDVPFAYEINSWRLKIFQLILPIVIWNLSFFDKKLFNYCKWSLVTVCIVVILYALYLRTLNGFNPYVMLMAEVNNAEILENQFGEQSSRLMIKISSVFTHPMIFGVFLGMAIIYIYAYRIYINRIVSWLLLGGIMSCIFVCGIRTPIAAIFVTIVIYLLYNRKIKTLTYFSIVAIIGYAMITQVAELSETINSMVDSESKNVGGSSIEMRLQQLNAAFYEIKDCVLFGKGFDYTTYYWGKYGSHPTLYSFESLIFVILCNSGFFGFIIWGIMFYKVYMYAKRTLRERETFLMIVALLTYYLSYTIITGEFGYLSYLLLFYVLIIIKPNTIK